MCGFELSSNQWQFTIWKLAARIRWSNESEQRKTSKSVLSKENRQIQWKLFGNSKVEQWTSRILRKHTKKKTIFIPLEWRYPEYGMFNSPILSLERKVNSKFLSEQGENKYWTNNLNCFFHSTYHAVLLFISFHFFHSLKIPTFLCAGVFVAAIKNWWRKKHEYKLH